MTIQIKNAAGNMMHGIYPSETLPVHDISAAAELHVVAVAFIVVSTDIVTRVVAVRRRPLWIASALLQELTGAAGLRSVVVATSAREVTSKSRPAR